MYIVKSYILVIMKKLAFKLGFVLLLGSVIVNSCKHSPDEDQDPVNPGTDPPFDTITCDSTNVTYNGIIYPLLNAYCISCHSGTTPSGALDFTDYGDVAFIAQSGQLSGAINHLQGFSPMPKDQPKLSRCEIALIEKWINDTTFVTPPDTTACDTMFITYPGTIYPLLQANCISCHGPPTFEAGLDFTNYEDVSFLAQSGALLGAVMHLPEFVPMPKDAPPLTDCEILQIQMWINDTTFIINDTTECDSSFVTYPGTIFPIFQENCLSCHAPPTPEAGIDLTDFEDVAFIAQTGRLMGAIRHDFGFTPMPQNGPPLSDCEIALIQKWINDTTFAPSGIQCDPDTVYFQNDILPLLMSSCGITGCHDEQTAEEGVILTSYYYVMQTAEVEPFQPGESKLYEIITEPDPDDRMPPPPASPLTNDQKNMIYTWISQGALNNYCEQEDCDSVNVSFSETIFPIVQNNCMGCHSGPSPNGNISLTNYTQIKNYASISPGIAGSLLGAITHSNGNIPMPQNGPPLSDCKIAQIRNWIDEGMLDN